jgi:RNA polymerase sigma-70 factor (ECF subfamily)
VKDVPWSFILRDGPTALGASTGNKVCHAEDGISENSPAPLDFRTLFELESPYVLRTLRRLGVMERDAEDMAHEVFVAVHRELPKYDRMRPIRPWLFAFCFRIASHHRRKHRHETVEDMTGGVVDPTDAADTLLDRERKRRLVLAALDEIEIERRGVFILHEIDGVTCEAIAQSLEIPLGTVYSRLRLAREDFTAKVRRLQARRLLE